MEPVSPSTNMPDFVVYDAMAEVALEWKLHTVSSANRCPCCAPLQNGLQPSGLAADFEMRSPAAAARRHSVTWYAQAMTHHRHDAKHKMIHYHPS
eukprot:scaffold676876_cov60-Prasinocladus_malaysianus.AAC.1